MSARKGFLDRTAGHGCRLNMFVVHRTILVFLGRAISDPADDDVIIKKKFISIFIIALAVCTSPTEPL